MDSCETVLQGNFRDGKLHGFVKGISLKEGILSFIGRFQKGRPVGNCWKGNKRILKYNTNSYFWQYQQLYWQQADVISVYIIIHFQRFFLAYRGCMGQWIQKERFLEIITPLSILI